MMFPSTVKCSFLKGLRSFFGDVNVSVQSACVCGVMALVRQFAGLNQHGYWEDVHCSWP